MRRRKIAFLSMMLALLMISGCAPQGPEEKAQESSSLLVQESSTASIQESSDTVSHELPDGWELSDFTVAGFDKEGPGDFGYRAFLSESELRSLPDLLDLSGWRELSDPPEYGLTVVLSLADPDLERFLYVMDGGDNKTIIKLSGSDGEESFVYSASEQCLSQSEKLSATLKDRASVIDEAAVLSEYIPFESSEVTAFEQATVYQGPSVVEAVILLDGENAKAAAEMLSGFVVRQDETTPDRTTAGGSYQKYTLWFGDETLTVCYSGTFHLGSIDARPICHIDMEFYRDADEKYPGDPALMATPDGIPMPGGSETVIYDIINGVRVERVSEEPASAPEPPHADPFENDTEEEGPSDHPTEPSTMEDPKGETRDFWTIREEMVQNAAAFKEQNADTVGWLYLYDTTIDSPVFQREGDNDYYLTHDDYHQYDKNGALFADFRDIFSGRDSQSLNLVLYGHSKDEDPDGGVESSREFEHFTEIKRYQDKAFCEKNPYFLFATPDESMVFEVFAAFHTKTEFIYNSPNPSNSQQQAILEEALKKSLFDFGVEVSPDDRIMTLSTCCRRIVPTYPNGYRFVVMGRLVEKGRLLTYERAVTDNPSALTPDNIYE